MRCANKSSSKPGVVAILRSCDAMQSLWKIIKECQPDIESAFVKNLHSNSSYYAIVIFIYIRWNKISSIIEETVLSSWRILILPCHRNIYIHSMKQNLINHRRNRFYRHEGYLHTPQSTFILPNIISRQIFPYNSTERYSFSHTWLRVVSPSHSDEYRTIAKKNSAPSGNRTQVSSLATRNSTIEPMALPDFPVTHWRTHTSPDTLMVYWR